MSVAIATMGMYGGNQYSTVQEVPVDTGSGGGGYGLFAHKQKPKVQVSKVINGKKKEFEFDIIEIIERK